jgi:energy-converting hydrogenase B subunit D
MLWLLFDSLLLAAVLFAAMAVFSKDLLKSVIFLSTTSLCMAMLFFLLNAPDIAITKAAVEAGVATAIFIVAIQKTSRFESDGASKKEPRNGPKD